MNRPASALTEAAADAVAGQLRQVQEVSDKVINEMEQGW